MTDKMRHLIERSKKYLEERKSMHTIRKQNNQSLYLSFVKVSRIKFAIAKINANSNQFDEQQISRQYTRINAVTRQLLQ